MKELKAKKSFGQNFLKDDNILNIIAKSIETNDDLIIEIGPGMGALTKKLKNKNSNLLAYEIDERTKKFLLPLEDDKTKIVYKDFLTTNIKEDISKYKYNKLYVIANIPYYITTPIIEHIISSKLDVNAMTLLVQKEVAERFSAKPGSKSYGSITVYLNYFYNIKYICDVSRNCFTPVPNVESAVVKFEKKENIIKVDNEEDFFEFIKICFKQKRKTLNNNLKILNIINLKEIYSELGFKDGIRAEELTLKDFINLYNLIRQK